MTSKRLRGALATALALLAATGAWTTPPAHAGLTFNFLD